MTHMNDKDRAEQPPKETGDKRVGKPTVKDLEPKETSQEKGGRRLTADPDEGGE